MDDALLPAGQVVPVNEHHKEFYERVREVCRSMSSEGKINDREMLALLAQITGQSLATQADDPGECYLSMMVNINYGQLAAYQQISQLMEVKGSA
jgi:hypothetical protein